jgi:hypothetical protein
VYDARDIGLNEQEEEKEEKERI